MTSSHKAGLELRWRPQWACPHSACSPPLACIGQLGLTIDAVKYLASYLRSAQHLCRSISIAPSHDRSNTKLLQAAVLTPSHTSLFDVTVQDTVAAIHFAGQYEEVQGPLLSVMRELAGSVGQGAHMCAGMLGGAMVACLSLSQVSTAPQLICLLSSFKKSICQA